MLRERKPIGIAHVSDARGGYDRYVAEIHVMLVRHEPREGSSTTCGRIETVKTGLLGDRRSVSRPPRAPARRRRLLRVLLQRLEARFGEDIDPDGRIG